MSESELEHDYPGIDRLHYFLSQVGMIVAVVFVVTVFGLDSSVMKIVSLLVMIAGLVLDVMRLRNIGVSQWFAMLRFIPFGGTALTIGLLCAQPGWIETRRLDQAGRSILAFEIILLAAMLIMFLRMGTSVPLFF